MNDTDDKVKISYHWDKERLIELEELKILLQDISRLDSSNNFTRNAISCIDRAKKFIDFDFSNRRTDLLTYMRDQGMTIKEVGNELNENKG